jgi:hypothetical protein
MIDSDQRVIIRFLPNEAISTHEITIRLQAQSGEHFYKLRTVQFWVGEVRFGRQDLHDEIRSGRPPLDDIDAKIFAILNNSPFELAHSIAERLGVTNVTVFNHLHLSIVFISFTLGPASVDRTFTPKTEGGCTRYIAVTTCCST